MKYYISISAYLVIENEFSELNKTILCEQLSINGGFQISSICF